ncbi:hypothetical protein B6U67_04225 [Methanosarcinales archaeon ex4484_138]|nr:MAG: hypothetical protein B6U67_04225 [Methanosarcinales archaeon ex4484_138]
MDRYKAIQCFSVAMVLFMLLFIAVSLITLVSAESNVVIDGHSEGGHFTFVGDGAEMNADITVDGFDEANVNLTNAWGYNAKIIYRNVYSGDILLSATRDYPYDPMYYYVWKTMEFVGDGEYVPPGGGGRLARLTNSPNVTGTIEYPQADHRASFMFDSRHTQADVTVLVHNGHELENATVTMYFTDPIVKWTDENGRADFKLSPGKYHMTVEADGFDAMIVDDLRFSADKRYLLKVNMTNCTCSAGAPVCGPSVDDLLLYYKKKGPAMSPISPQGYVNYFAGELRKCKSRDNPEADGTLERFATKWGIFPSPPLNVLLYRCNMTKLNCTATNDCLWNVTFTVKNYQKYRCNYVVRLVAGNTTTLMKIGTLGPTWSSTAMETTSKVVSIGNKTEPMYLVVESEKND